MAYKKFVLADQTPVTIYKRRGNRNLRVSVGFDGAVKISIPAWAPYRAGLEFARSRQDWIDANRRSPELLTHGQPVGKAHHLQFVVNQEVLKISSRTRGNQIIIKHPAHLTPASAEVQKTASRAATAALKSQAEKLLPQRLQQLAELHGFEYRSVHIKRLKSRWGSCDHHGNITLNLFLMQLPWDCIDYVLLHELTHTRIMRHGPDFWAAMEKVLPNVARLRKTMRASQPVLAGVSAV